MTDKETAIKAFEKANMYDNYASRELSFAFDVNMGGEMKNNYIRQVFLSHKFAKAFWGEEDQVTVELSIAWEGCDVDRIYEQESIPVWQYHLQQMVLEENILKYIEKFLGDKNGN